MNFILGARGCGKTYSTMKMVIKRFIKKHDRFIYLRRYDTELIELMDLFKSVINDDELKGYHIEVKGKNFYICKSDVCFDKEGNLIHKVMFDDKNRFGKAIALTASGKIKSKDYKDVWCVVFEEFIIKQQHIYYMTNEVNTFMELLETVFRHRPVRVFLLGNNLTTVNPYFTYFNIRNFKDKGITKYKWNGKKALLVWRYHSDEFINFKKNTDMGLLESNTAYGSYAIGNESLYDNEMFVEKKSPGAVFCFSLKYTNRTLGIWADKNKGKMYVSFKYPNGYNSHFACTTDDMQPNLMFYRTFKNNYQIKMLRDAYTFGYLYYENIQIKNIMNEIMKLFNII